MLLRALIILVAILWVSPALATFTLDSPPSLPSVTNGSFETALGSEWACTGCSTFARVTTPVYDQTYSLNFNGTNGTVKQALSLTASTAYSLTAYVRDNTASAGTTLKATYTGAPQETDVTSSLITNAGFEVTTDWQCLAYFGVACTTATTPVYEGSKSLKLSQRIYDTSYEDWFYEYVRRSATSFVLNADTPYSFKVWLNDNSSTYGGRVQVRLWDGTYNTVLCTADDTASNINTWTQVTCEVASNPSARQVNLFIYSVQGTKNTTTGYYTYVDDIKIYAVQSNTETLCTTTDTASNNGVWTKLTCNIPDTNTATTADINIVSPDGTNQFYVDKVVFEYPNQVKMALPSGSTGRTVKLFNESWAEAYSAVAGDTYAIINSSVAPGTYYWQVSATDGTSVVDKSNWITVDPSTYWTWTDDANKYTNYPWDIVLVGDTNSNGNCIDGAETGCYMKLQYRGQDYASFGQTLGNNLAAGKTVTASSSKSATCGEDGAACNATDENYNTRWRANTANVNEWVCIDLGASTTFNRVDLTWRALDCILGQGGCFDADQENYSANQINVQVSPTDTGCGAGDFANVTGGTPLSFAKIGSVGVYNERMKSDPLTTIVFAPQTKRYVKIKATAGRGAFWEVMVYNETATPSYDISHLVIDKRENIGTGGPTQNIWNGLKYDSYVTETDGSKTFTKNVSGWFNLTVNYKKMSNKVWRKRFTIQNTSAVLYRLKMSNVLHYPTPKTTRCKNFLFSTATGSDTSTACTTKYYQQFGVPNYNNLKATNVSTDAPVTFGMAADSGCNAQWADTMFGAEGVPRYSLDIIGNRDEDIWFQQEVNYGWTGGSNDGEPFFILKAGESDTFDITIFHSINLDYNNSYKEAAQAIAVSQGKGDLSVENQVFWAHAFQHTYSETPRDDYNPNICLVGYLTHVASRGIYQGMTPWTVMGLGDKEISQKVFLALRKAVGPQCTSLTICPKDAFSQDPPSLVGGPRGYPLETAIFFGYMVAKGWVVVQPTCSDYLGCVTTTERDALGAYLYQPPDGILGPNTPALMSDQLVALYSVLDGVPSNYLSMYIYALKAIESTGYTIDQTKFTAMKNELQSYYNSADGYVHGTKYGHWLQTANTKKAQRDTVRLPQANFTVPAGHTDASLVVKAFGGSDGGIWSVKKNGTDVAGSPFDLYSGPSLSLNQIESAGANAGTWLFSIYNISDPFMYKPVSFLGDYNTIEIRVKPYVNGPTSVQVFYTDGVDCTGISETCSQVFTGVLTADNTWQTIQLPMTDSEWGAGDTIGNLRIDFDGQTVTGTAEIDYIHVLKSGFQDYVVEDFTNILTEINTTTTVSTGDVITLQSTATKNASSSNYFFTLDKLVIGGTSYEQDDSNFQCGSMTQDCANGFSLGWKRWRNSRLILSELLSRLQYGEGGLTDAQLKSHLEHLASGNQGAGTLLSMVQDENNKCIPVSGGVDGGFGYWHSMALYCNYAHNGGAYFLYDSLWWTFGVKYLGDNPVKYNWDEKTSKFAKTGTWTSETDTPNYYQAFVEKSLTATDYMVFSGVPFSDAEVYLITGAGQGTAKIYFDNGSGYDAGTTIDLSTASNPVYTKTGQTYASGYKIKMEVVSGTVRVDYIRTNTKPSFMLAERIALEQTIAPWPNDMLGTRLGAMGYNARSGEGSALYAALYMGDAIQNILRRWYLEDFILRRYK